MIDFSKIDKTVFWKEKKTKNIFILLIAGIIILIAGSTFFSAPKQNGINMKNGNTLINETKKADEEYALNMQKRLCDILSKIDGAGKISVMLTMEQSGEITLAEEKKTDSSQNTEKAGESNIKDTLTQSIDSKMLMVKGSDSTERPVVVSEREPRILGAVVLSEGAHISAVREELYGAVEALLNISPNRIQVYKMSKK